jgi:RHS repeat-associated protein
MNQQRVATDISINYDPSGKGGGQQEHAAAKGSSATETTWSPALTDFNEVLVGLDQKPLDTASLKLPTLAAYYPETVTPSSTASTAESASTTPRILFWYHPDYLGNVDLVTERDGYAHEFFMYNPWGEEMHQWNANTYAFTSPYRFNAKELDPETGLAYYGARYYQNKLGVWLSVDQMANAAPGWTPYRFGFNNPIKFTDPNGLFETELDAKQWAKENEIRTGWFSRHKIEQVSDGSWAINNRKEGISYFREAALDGLKVLGRRDDGVIKSALVPAQPYNEFSAIASEIWNSQIARIYIPDKISISFSSSVTAFAGNSTDFSLNWITRGHDAQFTPYAVFTVGGQGGPQVSGDALINIGAGYYATSDMRSLQKGQARDGLLGWSAYESTDIGIVLGGSLTGSIGIQDFSSQYKPAWISAGLGIGASIGGGFTGGLSYSWPIVPGQFK